MKLNNIILAKFDLRTSLGNNQFDFSYRDKIINSNDEDFLLYIYVRVVQLFIICFVPDVGELGFGF